MLTKEETAFIDYWERNRLRRKKVVRQFLLGVPIGLLFAVPIVINLFSGWDKHADMEANNGEFDPRVLFVALLLIVGFTSIFWQRHKWDQYEQRYRELLARRERERARAGAAGAGAEAGAAGDSLVGPGAESTADSAVAGPGAHAGSGVGSTAGDATASTRTGIPVNTDGSHPMASSPADAAGTYPIVSMTADPESGLPTGVERESSHDRAVGPDESPAE